MNENEEKLELIRAMTAVEIRPEQAEEELAARSYEKLPLSRLMALGTGLEPIVSAVQYVLSNGEASTGFYFGLVPNGKHLAAFNNKPGFLGAYVGAHGVEGQTQFFQLPCNPAMLFMAATLANIDRKLDAIQETQQEMLDFLKAGEKAELRGNLEFLADVFNNYKYNWNSEKYKSANHIKALDIRQSAMRSLELYHDRIAGHMSKRSLLPSDRDVKKQLAELLDEMRDYRLALYLYGFAYLVEVLLQENFDGQYLTKIAGSISEKALEYRELYTEVYTRVEERTKSTLESKALGALSAVSRAAGKTIEKIPVISRSQLDENLISAGETLGERSEDRSDESLGSLTEYSGDCVRPFVEQLNEINRVYNTPVTLLFDRDALYLSSAT